ncbi:hypothetical protein HYN43_021485 [Mucilaginibacter celer]|uniref:Uncharacterized protein n=1 Tax=Mucilaginibacter celer TaxID=2305508 RepID=A0A494VQB0_9SPHI|nr:hypothetical protein HYN43_021485 [Mucilaginibacter celer]
MCWGIDWGKNKHRGDKPVAEVTHPDIAALVTLLYAARKEGVFSFIFLTLFTACCREGRPAKRSRGE